MASAETESGGLVDSISTRTDDLCHIHGHTNRERLKERDTDGY
jgi:hypothetical protein